MFIDGSAGSTGGGIKIIRWLLVIKGIQRELFTTAHPAAVTPVRLGGQVIEEEVIRAIYGFTLLYLLTFGVAAVLLMLDAGRVGFEITIFEAIIGAVTAYDTVCVGLSERSDVERLAFGSTARRVSRDAPGNVVIVRGRELVELEDRDRTVTSVAADATQYDD